MNPRTNYRLKDGDTVKLLNHARVAGYWYDPIRMKGHWDSHYILAGSVGIVAQAWVPSVYVGARARYFANVDIPHCGGASRVRVFHSELQRLR